MKKVYLDNAATTPLRKEVIETMAEVMLQNFGNPSSTHSFGRSAKNSLETSRKNIATLLNCKASEIIFTSSATEGINWILRSAIKDLKIEHIITSKIEHHATLHTILALEREFGIQVHYVDILPNGDLNIPHIETLLKQTNSKTLVSLLHVNNETGEILDIEQVGRLCKENEALFHCDTVQTIGKMPLHLNKLPIDFATGSAHKFHGPKGIGFIYMKQNSGLQPLLYGGEQEKGFRAGTEAVHQIAGMAKALALSYENLESEMATILELKTYCISQLKNTFPDVKCIGKNTFYTIINVILPFSSDKTAMLLFALDMKGIAVSRGSACQSGSAKPSHVLAAFLSKEDQKKPNLRISFSHFNTKKDVDYLIETLQTI